uniref:CTCK domain-containing protein n=1 Tax=Stegastes partitus TaxID=144197 RepID=A0A3B5ATB1_9TELE
TKYTSTYPKVYDEYQIIFCTPVNIVSCDGKCPSASIYNYNINTYARFCKCCRETGLQRRSVQLYCSGNATWVSYTIQEPTDSVSASSETQPARNAPSV